MGADIHARVEIVWAEDEVEFVDDALWEYPYFRHYEPVNYWNPMYEARPFHERNYFLFAFLADVRNYCGIIPLDEPRGMPENASRQWRAEVESWEEDIHSLTWFTYRELETALEQTKNIDLILTDGKHSMYYLVGAHLERALRPFSSFADGPDGDKYKDKIRFVMGFDN